ESNPVGTSLVHLIGVASRHALTESGQDLDAIMSTMEGEPTYQYFPAGKGFTGYEKTRRLYRHFIDEVQPRIVSYNVISESVGPQGAVQEYDIQIRLIGETEPSWHRIMAILVFGEQGLTGERMYSGEALFRTLTGPLWDEMEMISLDGPRT
ncbi:MAG TPA: hypothetical protein VN110_08880, partial [Sphingobium sp.]|nr:hypothetical protein [Sphingobium sp.]